MVDFGHAPARPVQVGFFVNNDGGCVVFDTIGPAATSTKAYSRASKRFAPNVDGIPIPVILLVFREGTARRMSKRAVGGTDVHGIHCVYIR